MLRRFPLIDGHNDLPWALRERAAGDVSRVHLTPASPAAASPAPDSTAPPQANPSDPGAVNLAAPVDGTHTDLPRLAAGGVGAQFWSVYVPARLAEAGAGGNVAGGNGAVAAVLEQIDVARRMIACYPEALELALTADDVERIFASGRVASLLGAEGGHAIAGSLGVLRMLYALGVRYLTLTHNANVGWADSATDEPEAGGLTEFGRDVVREMQRIGMLVDLSHVAVSTMNDALDVAEAPVIFSHSSAIAVCNSPRNVPDDVLDRLPDNNGVCMVTFVPMLRLSGVRRLVRRAQGRGVRARGLDREASPTSGCRTRVEGRASRSARHAESGGRPHRARPFRGRGRARGHRAAISTAPPTSRSA